MTHKAIQQVVGPIDSCCDEFAGDVTRAGRCALSLGRITAAWRVCIWGFFAVTSAKALGQQTGRTEGGLESASVVTVTALSNPPPGFVQLNLNSAGMNIIGDAANDPSLAQDPSNPDLLYVAWRNYDTIASVMRHEAFSRSADGGQTWSVPIIPEPGTYRYSTTVAVGPDHEVHMYASKRVVDPGHDFLSSFDNGATWPNPMSAPSGSISTMAIDLTGGIGTGNIYVTWHPYTSCCGAVNFSRSTDKGQHWTTPVNFLPYFGTMAIGRAGELFLVGTVYPYIYCARSLNAQNPAVLPTFSYSYIDLGGTHHHLSGPNPGSLLGRYWIAIDRSNGPFGGNVYVVGATGTTPVGEETDVYFARSRTNGVTWDPPMRINNDPIEGKAWQWFPTLSVAPNGRIDLVWNDSRESPANIYRTRLYYTYSLDGGDHWAPQIPISPQWDSTLGWTIEQNIGVAYQMVSENQRANLVLSATFNGEQDIYFTRLDPFDCNRNGVLDSEDIASGASEDCNSNGMPDECEMDCNHNGRPDQCELAAGDAVDCNLNGLPDSCDIVAGMPDCNGNGRPDDCDLADGTSVDCNANGRPDSCDVALGSSLDCNANGVPDECDLASGFEPDCNSNGVPDSCDVIPPEQWDCNLNGVPDSCDVADGSSRDCNVNGLPDECDIALGTDPDCNANGFIDYCELSSPHWALVFDGVNDCVTIPPASSLNLDSELTIEAWVLATSGGGPDARIYRNKSSSGAGISLCTSFNNDRRFQLRIDFAAGGNLVLVDQQGLSVYEGAWHHVAATYSRSLQQARLFVDGTIVASAPTVGIVNYSGGPIFLGGSTIGTRDGFKGGLDEIRVWGTARTNEELVNNYRRKLFGDEAGLISCWHFDEASDQVVVDSGLVGNSGWLGQVDNPDSRDPLWSAASCPLILNDCDGNGILDACELDHLPPSPNPMTFEALPAGFSTSGVAMRAVEAADCSGSAVQYSFEFTGATPPQSGHSSGWIPLRDYSDQGLLANTVYRYRVRARDSAIPPNETGPSTEAAGCTHIEAPAGIDVLSVGQTQIVVRAQGSFSNTGMGATAFYYDLSPGGGAGAGAWNANQAITISGLVPGQLYFLRAKARNQLGVESEYCQVKRVTTVSGPGAISP